MTRLRVYCPAKVNLFLAVGPRDARGYHPLRTIFQAIGLFDILEMEFGVGRLEIQIIGASLPLSNTVTKALRLGAEVFAVQPSSVKLTKAIPMEAGLGGGSSDAAGVLRGLNAIRSVPLDEIEPVAAAIGADVPFFLTGGRARATGYGDQIEPLAEHPLEWFLVAKPNIGCSTVEMFAKLDEDNRPWLDWPDNDELHNDFEAVIPRECAELKSKLLRAGARDAGLTGSGSCVFGRFRDEHAALQAQHSIGLASSWVAPSLTRKESLRIDLV